MSTSTTICLLMLVMMNAHGALCIRAVAQAVPSVAKRGENVILQCLYELQGAPLYTFKFYKGTHEFYRYSPTEPPPKKMFSIAGLYVDLTYSNETQVMLRNVDFVAAGNFSCEVSAEGPSFATVTVQTRVDVVVPPLEGPLLRTEADHYEIGDVLRANCTSAPSKPAVNLTILVNNQVLSLAQVQVLKVSDGLERSFVSVSMPITPTYYKGGKMVVRCVAQLHPVYLESAMIVFISMNQEPSWQRRLSSSLSLAPGLEMCSILLLISIALLVACASSSDDFFYEDLYYEDGVSEDMKISLIGA